jgi:cytochrome P450
MQSINPESSEALADRPAFYNHLREHCPIAKVDAQDYYLLSGYENVKMLLTDHERFSKQWGNQLSRTEPNYALNQDPPSFNAFRAIYNNYMSPKGVQRWTADCQRFASDLVDRLAPLGSGDLQQLFGKPLPAMVTAIALGLPEEHIDQYRAWTDAFLAAMIQDPREQARIIEVMYAFFTTEIERRRAQFKTAGVETPGPEHVGTVVGDNLISVLMTTTYQGRYLTDDELRRTIRGFFIGGVDTTGALILNTLYRLLERSELWQAVQADPSLIDAAIDESLRFDPPATGMFRGTTCPIRIGDEEIPEGGRVLYSVFSANRDPAMFEDPNSFRLDRKPKGGVYNFSFGGGAHFCPGAWTAKMEARVALEVIMRRLPRLRIAGQVEYFDVVNFWVIRSFPAAWD